VLITIAPNLNRRVSESEKSNVECGGWVGGGCVEVRGGEAGVED